MSDNTNFNPDKLKPLIGETFTATDAEGGQVQVRLHEVEENVIKGFDGESFIVDFQSEANAIALEGNYQVEHPEVGQIELLLSPSGETRCEAVVSRLKRNPENN